MNGIMSGFSEDEYAGLPVVEFERIMDGESSTTDAGVRPPVAEVAWRVGTSFGDKSFGEVFARFLDAVDTAEVTTLITGIWGGDYEDRHFSVPVDALTEAATSFPRLKSLHLGDFAGPWWTMPSIKHCDASPVFAAFPGLERFDVRGLRGLSFDPVVSEELKVLRVESCGLPVGVVRAVGESDLPNLEYLDLWLGVAEYGGDAVVADLAPFLSGERFPALRHLGLEDSEIQDEIAAAVSGAPIVAWLESLSLAMGNLTDQGAEALLSGQPLTHLRRLDLHHHFLTDPMMERVNAALPGVEVDLDGLQKLNDEWTTYVAVGG